MLVLYWWGKESYNWGSFLQEEEEEEEQEEGIGHGFISPSARKAPEVICM